MKGGGQILWNAIAICTGQEFLFFEQWSISCDFNLARKFYQESFLAMSQSREEFGKEIF